jgi:hypothetical protein
MGQVLHRGATTTEAVRRAIQHSQESLRFARASRQDGKSRSARPRGLRITEEVS